MFRVLNLPTTDFISSRKNECEQLALALRVMEEEELYLGRRDWLPTCGSMKW